MTSLQRTAAAEWLQKGDEDLEAARLMLASSKKSKLKNVICYHCQQAIEKYFKSILVRSGEEFRRNHNLDYLKEKAAMMDPVFKAFAVDKLTDYALAGRYPDVDYPAPAIPEIKKYVKTAEELRRVVKAKI